MATITCIPQGGIGNQLFIMAATISHALRYGIDYCIPTEVINPHYPLSPEQKQYKFPNVKYCDKPLEGHTIAYKEQSYHFQPIPLPLEYNNQILSGYFQSYKYFDDHRSEILKAFGFDGIVTIPDTCALHFRGGDYKKYLNHHPVISKEYIFNAINTIWLKTSVKKFIVFSDDMDEIRGIINKFNPPPDYDFMFAVGNDAISDFHMMASCAHSIISNSTFSWWASYVNPNPNKIVVAPKNWFGSDSAHNDTKDLYYPGTIVL